MYRQVALFLLPSLLALSQIGCGGCPEGQIASPVTGECVDEVMGMMNPNNTRDASIRDAAQGQDGGVGGDSGVVNRDGGGLIDGSIMNVDAGPIDGGSVGSDGGPIAGAGEIWLAELQTSAVGAHSFRVEARLKNLNGVGFDQSNSSFNDLEGGSCRLDIKRVSNGTPTGLEAEKVHIVASPLAGATFDLLPRGNGLFTPDQNPIEGMFNTSVFASARIDPSASPTSLDAATMMARAPINPALITPGFGTPINLTSSPQFMWTPSGVFGNRTILEVADRDREVVLFCDTSDDGTYTLVPAAGTAFRAANPVAPVKLELRSENASAIFGTVQGVGRIPINLRVAWGSQFDAQMIAGRALPSCPGLVKSGPR